MRAEQEEARKDGDQGKAERLEGEIGMLESALKGKDQSRDAGERARDNVRKAIANLVERLEMGSQQERAFAAHIKKFVKTGYDVSYSWPGEPWV